MFIPGTDLLQEMLGTPTLARFAFPPSNEPDRIPVLAIKADTLVLKYITQNVPINLFFFTTTSGHSGYAVHIQDDPVEGVILWSLLGSDQEVAAFRHLAKQGTCKISLFNELCVNCASAVARIEFSHPVPDMANALHATQEDTRQALQEVSELLGNMTLTGMGKFNPNRVIPESAFTSYASHHILNGSKGTALNLLSDNEGSHQEQIAHTLLGDLTVNGAYPNPQLHEPSGQKEFTDVLLSYEGGTFLFESKTLSIFEQRAVIPDRAKLARNIEKSALKALKQLTNAVRKLKDGTPIFDQDGNELQLERQEPPHAIILVPDLNLMAAKNDEWLKRTRDFHDKNGAMLHILDPIQLFRCVQAAEMIAASSETGLTTPIMAFDFRLLERLKTIAETGVVDLDIVLRLE